MGNADLQRLTRRDFLKLLLLAATSVAWQWPPWPDEGNYSPADGEARWGRVTVARIGIYAEPSLNSPRVGYLYRDMVLRFDEVLTSPHGPPHNPKWYRLGQAFVYSAYIQPVQTRFNPVRDDIPPGGRPATITVPYTRAYRPLKGGGWQRLYRLYYGSVHWVMDLRPGPDGRPWYCLNDEWMHIMYCIPATHARFIEPDEVTPLSPHVPAHEKHIIVNLDAQRLTAYEGDEIVFETQVSTGIPTLRSTNGIPTKTPTGKFRIYLKTPNRHMGDGRLTDDIAAYELPGVPWVSFFHTTGVAFHGTYWHDNFGRPMSHGCVNMRTDEALWLYRWSMPHVPWDAPNGHRLGTLVRVFERDRD